MSTDKTDDVQPSSQNDACFKPEESATSSPSFNGPTTEIEQPHPLDEIVHLYRAFQRCTPGEIMSVELPDELMPIPFAEGKEVIDRSLRTMALAGEALRDDMIQLRCTAHGTEFGDYLQTRSIRPNPELADRVHTVGQALMRQFKTTRAAARLLRCYESLASFFRTLELIRTPPDDQRPLQPTDEEFLYGNKVMDPDVHKLLYGDCPDPIEKWGEHYGRTLDKACLPSAEEQQAFFNDFPPLPYAEGMRRVWALTERLPIDARALDNQVGQVCQAVVRTAVGEILRGGLAPSEAAFPHTAVVAGAAASALLDELCIQADLFGAYTSFDELTTEH